VACGGTAPATAGQTKPKYSKPPALSIDTNKTYTATVQTSCGTMVVKLDPRVSLNAVNSFVFLAKSHFFDGLIFHRIAKGFVDQGGDPLGSGSGGPGYSTRDIPPKGTRYPLGAVAMAKSGNEPPGTAGSQFFIVTGQQGASLPADYALIGSLTSGQDVANRINDLPTVNNVSDGMPLQRVYIVSVTIKVS
jgi:peptidyl-prolyl cis-trans isomerase B (cyclophilin B)